MVDWTSHWTRLVEVAIKTFNSPTSQWLHFVLVVFSLKFSVKLRQMSAFPREISEKASSWGASNVIVIETPISAIPWEIGESGFLRSLRCEKRNCTNTYSVRHHLANMHLIHQGLCNNRVYVRTARHGSTCKQIKLNPKFCPLVINLRNAPIPLPPPCLPDLLSVTMPLTTSPSLMTSTARQCSSGRTPDSLNSAVFACWVQKSIRDRNM